MKTSTPNQRLSSLRLTAFIIAVLILVSSVAMTGITISASSEYEVDPSILSPAFQTHPCEISSVISQMGLWVSFDSSAPGTPAETHVTVSDTSGVTIVADFHGFWRDNYSIGSTTYDALEMPGVSHIREPGQPMLPCLSKFVEIPPNVDIATEVIASSSSSTSGYNIRPASPLSVPLAIGQYNSTLLANSTASPDFFGPVYSNDSLFPETSFDMQGQANASSIVVRGHRLLGLSLYPVRYNPVTQDVVVYSQLVVKVKYSFPAQIQPIPDRLRSQVFEQMLMNEVVNYDKCQAQFMRETGKPIEFSRTAFGYPEGAEYLVITTEAFKNEALRLAEWKARKGIPSAVLTVESTVEDVARNIQEAYKWEPAPTYVVLFGDVEAIPTNYDMIHEGRFGGKPIFEDGYIASDLGYFNVEGNSYFPDMIYSRISVDTVEQAEAIVSKTIQYEIDPPADPLFYNSMLLAGTFEDKPPFKNGIEDAAFPFIYHLERIRHYLEDNHEYAIHFNYSCAGLGTEPMPEYFHAPLTSEISSIAVRNSLPADYEWLWAYDHPLDYDEARLNITKNINEGRFLVLYYSHGGSKNMIYPVDVSLFPNGYDRNDRDIVEGWQTPYFNTSYFSDLTNGDLTPLVVSIACNTGWFDGETDEGHMDIAEFDPNPFEDYENECFAENITRIEEGGAVAAISASRPSYGLTCGDLLDGIVGAFWPGFLGYQTEPIYEMGSALYFGKLYMASKWLGLYTRQDVIRTTFEEFHLFGDPETQLWTEDPSSFSVSHPISISTSGTQRFVVTVRDLDSEPVNYAKVCIQQGTHVYQVGYTNQAGQVIFDVNPADTPASLNVTVTKHNFRPYLGEILVKPSSAEVTLSEYSGFPLDTVTFTLSGFDANYPIRVYMDDSWVATIYSGTTAYGLVPIGPEGHVNVWVAHYSPYDPADLWEPVAVNRYYRLSTELHPDPYIYSLNDRSTWHLADGNKVWNNPCITLYEGDNPATEIRQNSEYDVKVKVYNRGNADAPHTTVSLYYAPFGGGVSWTRVGWQLVSIDMSGEAEASIKWRPLLPNTAYLQVVLETTGEKEEDELNNVGWESVGVVPLCSPGATSFQVRNPTDQTEYIFIKVKQQGDYDDVWNATILDYSSQAMSTGESETVTFFVDPQTETGLQEGHRFTTEIYVNCELLGGMEFNATQAVCLPSCCPCCCLCLLIIGGLIIAGVAVWYRRRN